MESGWGEPWMHRELVQIGAIRFSLDTLTELDEFDILIKPVKNPILSDYFSDLTGITNAAVQKQGHDFPDAYRLFTAFIGKDTAASFGGDASVMRENLTLNGMPATEDEFDCFDIGPWFMEYGAAYGIRKGINSGKLAAVLGAGMESIQEHNALHDVRSICAAYRFLIHKGAKSPF